MELMTKEILIEQIQTVLFESRKNVAKEVNTQLLQAYWNIGRLIIEYEQDNNIRAEYGKQTLKEISKTLTNKIGRGFSVSNLQFMRRFFQKYKMEQIQQTASVKLSWSHYCELLTITDDKERSFYEKEAEKSNWSFRELKRQIDSSLFQRLLLSEGNANKEKVLELSQKGIEVAKPKDIIKDPYVFEFLGIPENKPFLEKDIEDALVRQLENFFLELGRGFMYVGRQQRVTINNTHYYVDTEKDSVTTEYALGGLSNNIFASRYVLYMPDKDALISQVEEVLKSNS